MALLLKVNTQESGLKLFAFLRRCLLDEDAELYRWIRTGQVRINSGRAKSSSRVQEGDSVRVPPFAQCTVLQEHCVTGQSHANDSSVSFKNNKQKVAKNFAFQETYLLDSDTTAKEEMPAITFALPSASLIIPKIYENEHLLILNKPANLASQGGTGQRISLVEILKQAYKSARFTPAPVHRLDKMTSGLLCVGKSYMALRYLSDLMQEDLLELEKYTCEKYTCEKHSLEKQAVFSPYLQKKLLEKGVRKEYLAWVHAKHLEVNAPFIMEHDIYFDEKKGKMCGVQIQKEREFFASVADNVHATCYDNLQGKYALSQAVCLMKCGDFSLLKIGIFTGRKHQIRVQCAALGFPIVGDTKYGVTIADTKNSYEQGLKLHAFRLVLPENNELYNENVFESLPSWGGEFAVRTRDLKEFSRKLDSSKF